MSDTLANNLTGAEHEGLVARAVDTWVRPEIRALSAYHVPDATGLIKLDAMENPYTLPEELRDPWLASLREQALNRYPDPQASELQQALRETMGIAPEMGLVLGNGSDELIQMLALALGAPGRTVLSFEPGFVMYRMIATFAGLEYVGVPLRADNFALDLDAALAAIETHRPAVTFIAYPNNPTGNLFDAEAIARIIEASPGLVVVDEAYAPFTDHSFLSRLGEWPNLLVLRTVSKMGLAGLRLGYLAGPPEWIREIDKTRLPYNINVLTQASAVFALNHATVFDAQTREIRAERERLAAALDSIKGNINGLVVYPSEANFILLRVAGGTAGRVFDGLKAAGVLIKKLDGAHPQLHDCLRVTVGTAEENQEFLAALATLL
ncbi:MULTISPECIES: histidinol-phosphate transaminase [Thiorhodovibrio]|uniref:histidinol-phosphate transaminase n=1 Tax=Thiorhodovibrio TaxID=61593 RepID=UPI00191266F5|nr:MULTISPECIES: histidinol-phosphate transaminase [Thiorhodovibrio]MBK5967255.1 histidinol-phosphate transaminase [Thiorhodovibrio winogradskyi]WPL14491.1 Histidinol-phosphate aminotransferase 2 [Thiorhodovibrio litoralis]